MTNINVQDNIYQGLSDSDLIYLFKELPIEVSIHQQESLFLELLDRYLKQGRTFNLYNLIKEDMRWFMYTIGIELSNSLVNIPVDHAEAYTRGLLNFVELIEKNKDKIVKWEMHELAGLKDLLDTLKQAKVKDMVFIQRVNLLIERINKEREIAVAEASPTAIVERPEHYQLMQQQIKKHTIALSRLNKDGLLDTLRNLSLYDETMKDRIISTCIRKFESDAFKIAPTSCLRWVITNKYDKLTYPLHIYIINAATSEAAYGDDRLEKFLVWLEQWYMSLPNATADNYKLLLRHIDESINKYSRYADRHTKNVKEKVQQFLPILHKYRNKTLSEVLKGKIKIKVGKSINDYPSPTPILKNGEWVVHEETYIERECSIIEYWNMLHKELQWDSIEGFTDFPSYVQIDRVDLDALARASEEYARHRFSSHDRALLRDWFNKKSIREHGGFTKEELQTIYGNLEDYKVWKKFIDLGFFENDRFIEPIAKKYIKEIMELFDLSKENDRQTMFTVIPHPGRQYNVHHDLIYNKLKKEYPHETYLIESICDSAHAEDVIVQEMDNSILGRILGLVENRTVKNATKLYGSPVPKEEAIKVSVIEYFYKKFAQRI